MITKSSLRVLKRRRCSELSSEAAKHGGYLWTPTDLDNAMEWFTDSNSNSNTHHDHHNGNGDGDGDDGGDTQQQQRQNKDTNTPPHNKTKADAESEDGTNGLAGLNLLRSLLQNPGVWENRPPPPTTRTRRRRRRPRRTGGTISSTGSRNSKGKWKDGDRGVGKGLGVEGVDGDEGGRGPLLPRVILHYVRQALLLQHTNTAAGEHQNQHVTCNTAAGDGHNGDNKPYSGKQIIQPPNICIDIDNHIENDADDDDDAINSDNNANCGEDKDDNDDNNDNNDNNDNGRSQSSNEESAISLLCNDILPIATSRYTTETLFHAYENGTPTTSSTTPKNPPTVHPEGQKNAAPSPDDIEDENTHYLTQSHTVIRMAYASELYGLLRMFRSSEKVKASAAPGIKEPEDGRDGRSEHTRPSPCTRLLDRLVALSRLDIQVCEVLALMALEPMRDRRGRWLGEPDDALDRGEAPTVSAGVGRLLASTEEIAVRCSDRGEDGGKEERRDLTTMLCRAFICSALPKDATVCSFGDDGTGSRAPGRSEGSGCIKIRNDGRLKTRPPSPHASASNEPWRIGGTVAWDLLPLPLLCLLSNLHFPVARAYVRFLVDRAVQSYRALPYFVSRSAANLVAVDRRVAVCARSRMVLQEDGGGDEGGDSKEEGEGCSTGLRFDTAAVDPAERFDSCICRLKRLGVMDGGLLLLIGDVIAAAYDRLAVLGVDRSADKLAQPSTGISTAACTNDERRSSCQALEEVERRIFILEK